MTVAASASDSLQPVSVPLWREALLGVDWLALRLSPVYYGIGIPRGDGAPVVIIPGFLGSDNYLIEMYYWLRRIGYQPYYSRIGRNAECPDLLRDRLFETMDRAYEETGQKLHLVGHSLGGLLARSAALRRQERVEQVITLASPFQEIRVHPMVLAAAGFVRNRIRGREQQPKAVQPDCYTGACTCDFAVSVREDLPAEMKRTAIYTETDGVVDWRTCIEEDDRFNIRVDGTHSGLAFNPQVYRRIAYLLSGNRRRDGATPGGRRRRRSNSRAP